MKFTQFKLLDSEEQYLFWLAKAVEVSSFQRNGYLYVLYQLDDFYVEMSLKKVLPQTVLFEAFIDSSRLNAYLDKIDISELTLNV